MADGVFTLGGDGLDSAYNYSGYLGQFAVGNADISSDAAGLTGSDNCGPGSISGDFTPLATYLANNVSSASLGNIPATKRYHSRRTLDDYGSSRTMARWPSRPAACSATQATTL